MFINKILIRFFDILFSSLAILVLFPFMIPIMIILKLTGEHDIFYKQKRVGRYGKEFEVFKFATMLRNSPNLPGGTFTYKDDPRILPMGKFLRKTKINELPQLLNVLTGQMSFVAYRPLVRIGYDKYSDEIKEKIFMSKLGITGIASLILIHEEEIMQEIDDKDSFYKNIIIPYKGKLEQWFVENKNIWIYFYVIVLTVLIIIKPSVHFVGRVFKNLPVIPEELEQYLL